MRLRGSKTAVVRACIFACLASALTASPVKAADGKQVSKKTIFKLIDEILDEEPIDLARLKALTGGDFYVVREIGQRTDYEVKNIALKNVSISLVDFRSGIKSPFIVLHLSGCISKTQIARRFRLGPPELNGTDAMDTGVYFEAQSQSGHLGFEFLYANPDCLSSVSIQSP